MKENKLQVKFNGATLCVFANIDKSIMVHLANIDTKSNRIYTTFDGYDLIATQPFKANHKMQFFDKQEEKQEYDDSQNFGKSLYRKFDVAVDFTAQELSKIIAMCSRELVW